MKFAVIIPTYNRRHSIGAAIDSALAEGAADLGVEVFVIDDRSTDDTLAYLSQTYAARPVHILSNAGRKGPAGGRNTGLAAVQARGGFDAVALLDSDDRFLAGHLREAAALLRAEPGVQVLFGRARYVQAGQEVAYMGPLFERKLAASPTLRRTADWSVFERDAFFASLLAQGCWFNLSSVVLSGTAMQQRMREELRVSEDYEFWVRLARGHGFACLHRPQIEYSLGEDNISFESVREVQGHAPQLLQALAIMAAYPGLDTRHRQLIADQQAGILFDWAWRAGESSQPAQALALHLKSLRLGRRGANLAALAKLLPKLLRQRLSASPRVS